MRTKWEPIPSSYCVLSQGLDGIDVGGQNAATGQIQNSVSVPSARLHIVSSAAWSSALVH